MELLVIPISYYEVSMNSPWSNKNSWQVDSGKKSKTIIIKKPKTCKFLQILI